MERFDLIQVEGKICACVSPSLFQVELPNGHRFLAHAEPSLLKEAELSGKQFLPGRGVLVELRAFDLSAGRILTARDLYPVRNDELSVGGAGEGRQPSESR